MRYRRLKAEILGRDRPFTYRVTTNYFTMVRKCGPLSKYRDSLFGEWQDRFVVLTNAGMLYFKAEQMKKDTELEPQNFKPLCDFVVAEVTGAVSKQTPFLTFNYVYQAPKNKLYTFKIIFAKDGAIQREMLMAAPSEKDKDEWITAFRAHQIDMFEARSKYFDRKLKAMGMSRHTAKLE